MAPNCGQVEFPVVRRSFNLLVDSIWIARMLYNKANATTTPNESWGRRRWLLKRRRLLVYRGLRCLLWNRLSSAGGRYGPSWGDAISKSGGIPPAEIFGQPMPTYSDLQFFIVFSTFSPQAFGTQLRSLAGHLHHSSCQDASTSCKRSSRTNSSDACRGSSR